VGLLLLGYLNRGGLSPLWVNPPGSDLPLALHLLLPGAILLLLASFNLLAQRHGESLTPVWAGFGLAVLLTGQLMLGTAHQAHHTASLEAQTIQTLAEIIPAADPLLITVPTTAQAQAISLDLLAFQDQPWPTYLWLEAEPTYLAGTERAQIWQAVAPLGVTSPSTVWLYEPALQPTDPLGAMAHHLQAEAFPQATHWLTDAGRLTGYALTEGPISPFLLNVPFAGDITLIDFAIATVAPAPGQPLKVRLTWQMDGAAPFDPQQPPLVAFVHLLADSTGLVAAQRDRTLVDFPNHHQSALLPGQTTPQGYSLDLPPDLAPGGYALIVGLYDAQTLQRRPRADDSPDDFLYLTTIVIE
jgi:hypothetical protein